MLPNADMSNPYRGAGSPGYALVDDLDAVLGSGAHGVVYSLRSSSNWAVKEIPTDRLPPDVRASLELELQTLPRLRHPNIVECGGIVRHEGYVYIKMKRYETSVCAIQRSYKRTRQSLPRDLVLSIARQVAAGLAHLHKNHEGSPNGGPTPLFVHGNLKPTNILANKEGLEFVISDARMHGWDLTSALTRTYMSPETLLHEQYLPASDVWSLGAILYELVTGTTIPFLRSNTPENVFVEGWTPDLSEVRDPVFKAILEHIFVLDPGPRLTADELVDLLHENVPFASIPWMLRTRDLERELRGQRARQSPAQQEDHGVSAPQAPPRASTSSTRKHPVNNAKKNSKGSIAPMTTTKMGGEDTVECPDATGNGVTALMKAADRGDVEAVAALIPLQAGRKATRTLKINGYKMQGGTALMRAAARGHAEVVRLLVEHESGIRDNEGKTALMHAAFSGTTECAALLLEESNMQDVSGKTALMYAASAGKRGCVELLLKREGGVQSKDGGTALMLAAMNGRTSCVELLAGKEGGKRKTNGWTALMYAARNGRENCIGPLLKKEAHIRNNGGWTALMCAARNGKEDCVRLLLGEKDIKKNNAALMIAQKGYFGCTKLLAEKEGEVATDNQKCKSKSKQFIARLISELGGEGNLSKFNFTASIKLDAFIVGLKTDLAKNLAYVLIPNSLVSTYLASKGKNSATSKGQVSSFEKKVRILWTLNDESKITDEITKLCNDFIKNF